MTAEHKYKGLILAEDARSLIWTRKEILVALITNGIQLDAAVPLDEYQQQLENMGCNVIPIQIERRGMNPFTDFKLMMQFRRILKRGGYDFAISYSIKPNIYGGFMLRLAHVPFFINITGMGTAMNNAGLLRKLVCFLYRRVSPYAKGVFFENASNCRCFVDWKLCSMEQTQVFSGAGINLREYPFLQYPSPNGELHLLYIGRLMPEKGLREICAVAKRCVSDFPQIHFDLVGACEDEYKAEFGQYESLPNMHWHGFQENVRPFIEKANAIVLPSYHEGMANVLLEGGAMGRPLLTSCIPGCQEAVLDGKTGFLFEPRSQEALFEAVQGFAALSDEERTAMGTASSQHIAANFNRDRIVEKVCTLVKETISR